MTRGRSAAKWIVFVALLFLGGGLAVAVRQWKGPRSGSVTSSTLPKAPADTSDPIPRALKQAGGEDEKSRWIDDLPEVDLASLDGARREIFLRQVNTRRCTCGCGFTLAACRIYDATCDKSLPRVRAVFDSVASGRLADATGMRERPANP